MSLSHRPLSPPQVNSFELIEPLNLEEMKEIEAEGGPGLQHK